MRLRVFEYVPLLCLVLVWFVHAIYCLVLVGSDLQTLVYVHWVFCFCVYGIYKVWFLKKNCDKFLSQCVEDFHWCQKLRTDVFMMCGGVVFCSVARTVSRAWSPIEATLFWHFRSHIQYNCMSMDFVRFVCMW